MDWLRPCLDRAVRRWPWLASSWSLIWLAPWEKGLVPNHRISLCWWVLNWKVDFWLDWLESKNPRCHGVWSRYEPSPFGRVSDRSNLMTLSLNAPQGRAICLCAEPESHQGLRDLKVEMHVTKNIYTILFWTPVDCTPMGFRFEWLNHIISNGLVAASFKLSKTRNRNPLREARLFYVKESRFLHSEKKSRESDWGNRWIQNEELHPIHSHFLKAICTHAPHWIKMYRERVIFNNHMKEHSQQHGRTRGRSSITSCYRVSFSNILSLPLLFCLFLFCLCEH